MKESQRQRLLEIDSVINLVLGAALLARPKGTIAFFGLPATDTAFYVSILGAILLGIGIALWLERRNEERWRGLGLVGAVVINLLGGGTVLAWLIVDPFVMPVRGYVVLWAVVVLVIGTAVVEVLALLQRRTDTSRGGYPH
jgi:hypothetical protein